MRLSHSMRGPIIAAQRAELAQASNAATVDDVLTIGCCDNKNWTPPGGTSVTTATVSATERTRDKAAAQLAEEQAEETEREAAQAHLTKMKRIADGAADYAEACEAVRLHAQTVEQRRLTLTSSDRPSRTRGRSNSNPSARHPSRAGAKDVQTLAELVTSLKREPRSWV